MTNSADNALSAKRVGQYLIDSGVLKAEQLDEALNRQKRMSKAGFHVLLGTILEEMGAIDRQSLEAVILRQRLDEGSVSLGSEADWAPFRSAANAEAPTQAAEYTNGHTTPAPKQSQQDVELTEPVIESSDFQYEPEAEEPGPLNGSTTAADIHTLESDPGDTNPALFTPGPEAESTSPREPESGRDYASTEPTYGASEYIAQPDTTTVAQEQTNSASYEPTPSLPERRFEQPSPADTSAPPPTPNDQSAPMRHTAPAQGSVSSPSQPAEAPPRNSPPAPLEVLGFTFARTEDGGLHENEVVAVIAQLMKRSQALEAQLSELSESVSHLDSMRRYGEQTIKAADTIADQIRTEAEQQATATRDRAQQEARRIIAEGRSRHDHILRQAAETARRLGAEVIKNIDQHRKLNDHLMEVTDAIVNTEPDTSVGGASN